MQSLTQFGITGQHVVHAGDPQALSSGLNPEIEVAQNRHTVRFQRARDDATVGAVIVIAKNTEDT